MPKVSEMLYVNALSFRPMLDVVPDGGRLYILIHGTRRGCGSRKVYGRAEELDVSGRELADHLRNNGLKNRTTDLRLWTCLGANVTRLKDSTGREQRDERGQVIDSSFLLQFSSALQETHPKICFTGYTLPVSIDEKEIATSGVKKLALTSEAMGTGPLTLGGTSGFKVTVDAVKTNGCRPCYITTATCRGIGLADDCRELQLLRRFRDEVLLVRPEGRAEVGEYYAMAPLIVAAIDREDDADAIYRDILTRHLTPAVTAVAAGAHGDAYRLYRRMVVELYTRFVSQCDAESVVKGSKVQFRRSGKRRPLTRCDDSRRRESAATSPRNRGEVGVVGFSIELSDIAIAPTSPRLRGEVAAALLATRIRGSVGGDAPHSPQVRGLLCFHSSHSCGTGLS